jgi:peptidyl-prolyl cis-trans isomerase C
MNYRLAVLALTSFVIPVLAQSPAPAAPPGATKPDANKVILTIGDEKLTEADYNAIVDSLPTQYQAQARGAAKRAFAEQLIQLRLLAAEAKKQKLDEDDKIKKQIAFSNMTIIAGAEFQYLQENLKIDDAAIEKYYNEHKGEFEVVKARHILIHVKGGPGNPPKDGKPDLTEEQALAKVQALHKRLVDGEDFNKLAEAESDDSSANQGGYVGEFGRGMMVAPFEQAAFALKPGELSEPVKSPFGYHLIKVESHSTKSLADVKASITTKLRPELARQALDSMRKNVKVDIDESYFGPAMMPAIPQAPR